MTPSETAHDVSTAAMVSTIAVTERLATSAACSDICVSFLSRPQPVQLGHETWIGVGERPLLADQPQRFFGADPQRLAVDGDVHVAGAGQAGFAVNVDVAPGFQPRNEGLGQSLQNVVRQAGGGNVVDPDGEDRFDRFVIDPLLVELAAVHADDEQRSREGRVVDFSVDAPALPNGAFTEE